ncbi:MAG TPA: NAD-dependent epimerase [Gammaproteobacteria bacterium]|nr:NAD-dependent epimerase [Gammaproteobacteria bacterium]
MSGRKILVTGAAGFIGHAVASRLLARGDAVIGLDNLNAYYDVRLKEARLARLTANANFRDVRADVADRAAMTTVFARERPDGVVHLAAQAGVRYSLENPQAYVESNLAGFVNLCECCRAHPVRHLVYASTSSVYGANEKLPFAVADGADHPVSLYAATKRANELIAHAYSHLFAIPATGLRFFTVYGPWGRPDMALFKFTRSMLAGEPIEVYNHGKHRRDFTYIDDIAEGVVRVLDRPPAPNPNYDYGAPTPAASGAPWRVYNIGHGEPVPLMAYIRALEETLGIEAKIEYLPLQPGDVEATAADVSALERDFGYRPAVAVREGIERFVAWYREYYAA